jgi:peptide chain release factor 1
MVKIDGPGAGKAFAYEPGKHCVQRISPTETKGRKHTSMVVVGVLPLKEDADLEPLKDDELEVLCQRGHGKGGQHQNTTCSQVRMKHLPTGLSVVINGRDQFSNKREALKILTARVHEHKANAVDSDYSAIRRAQLADGGRSNKVRTYNFLKSTITDHRLDKKTGNVKGFMNGKFEVLFDK